ncbi:type II toxin-antitoxin system RelE/ParE family toxin [Streptomyces coriariae]|uniref:type II toxin-antitoxin system RelE/ParE family toxin n=1 Tax=Streptomyces coriariae TaxID=2864460 RepID=UPI003555D64A
MLEAARTTDGSYKCDEFFLNLEGSRRKKDRARLADILMVLEDFAHRELIFPREINNLEDGIRELKPGDVRLPFFDVPGTKVGAVRLTHGFIKGTRRTPRKEILKALWVREEDARS